MTGIAARPTRRPSARWGVPLGVAALVIGGTALGPAVAASAGVDLPDRTAAELLTDLQGAEVTALSGTVVIDADLGLPSLDLGGAGMSGGPGGPGGSSTDLLAVLSGTTTVRVWADGPKARIAVQGDGEERALISDGTQVWTWSSADLSVTHATLPEHGDLTADSPHPDDAWIDPEQVLTPEALAELVLETSSPTTTIGTGPAVSVAGRPAHELVLTPAEPGSLVAQIRIAVDAAERVPTRVEIYSTTSSAPALSVGFTSVSFTAPDAGLFSFTPPAGATVTEHGEEGMSDLGALLDGHEGVEGGTAERPELAGAMEPPTVVGTGWASVLVVPGSGTDPFAALEGVQDPEAEGTADLGAALALLPEVSGPWGSGRLLTSALVSALLLDDGTLLIGSVDGTTLQSVASTLG
ncbi:outer membrane lipoprotein carrier protein LolA [Actinotalea sp.]|uniref:LolA family protein n=1 Tax=Actinotalea sp. TaxID=1872145 RepID=UPI00356462D6